MRTARQGGRTTGGCTLADSLQSGDRVEIRRRFDDQWTPGFEVIDVSDAGLRVKRVSDGAELPALFHADEVRPEASRDRRWWRR
jgi:hypothetical protein